MKVLNHANIFVQDWNVFNFWTSEHPYFTTTITNPNGLFPDRITLWPFAGDEALLDAALDNVNLTTGGFSSSARFYNEV